MNHRVLANVEVETLKRKKEEKGIKEVHKKDWEGGA